MKTGSKEILERLLTGLEKERRRVRIARGIVESLLVLSASLGLVSLFAHFYTNNSYFSILKIFVIMATCFGFLKFVLPAILKKEEKAKLALELEKISPGLGEDTLNAVLLASDSTKPEKELGVSKPLIEAHIDKVTRKLESLDLSSVVPKEKVKSYRKPLAAAFVLSVTLLILAPKEFRSFLFSSNILPTQEPYLLELADIKIEYKYPVYTKIPSRVIKGSIGDVKATKGTHVTFRATPIRHLEQGKLVIEKGPTIPVTLEKEEIKTEFVIISSGSFFIEDKSGKYRSKIFRITSLEDKSPKVVIEAPRGDVIEIGEKENLDIYYRAEDDFGLTKLVLVWEKKSGEATRVIEQMKKESKSIEGKFTWNLSGIESEPGEIIEAKIRAYDNDTVSGPKVGVSNSIKFKLKNPKKRHEDILASLEKVLEELLNILGDEIENHPANNSINVSDTKKIQDNIASKIEKAIGSLEKTLEKMKDDDFSDYTYFLGLSNMKVRIGDLLDERNNLLSSFSIRDLPRLSSLVTREINEFEDDILFLDSMLKGETLRESLLYGRDTLSKYKELLELMEKLKTSGDEETKREIEKRIEELRNLMYKLTEKLSSMNRDIYEGFLNPDAFDSIDLEEKLDEIMKLVEKGKIDEALSLLASLGSSLQDMVASLESGFRSFSSASLSKETTKLGEVISRIKSVEEAEKSLKGKTEDFKESLLQARFPEENLLNFLERERKKIEELKNLLRETEAKVFEDIPENDIAEGSLLIDRLLQIAGELEQWLQAFEFKEALKHAKDVEGGAIGLKNLSRLGIGRTRDAEREIRKSAELAREIRQDIEQLEERGTKKEKTYQLAGRQDEIEKETSGLAEDIRGLEDDLLLSPEIGEKLGESREFMRRASRNLRQKEISKAISNQEEAIKSLEKARKEAEGLLDKYQMAAKGMGPSVPLVLGRNQLGQGYSGIDTSYVDIPSSEESKVGKEFKENLLRALKEGSPPDYIELNKRYYERIIK
jgi:hypothetical protein